jgi:3-oxoacyl-[acyl-carrier-protein] synthase II
MRRAFVTGVGVVTPIATGREEFWSALVSGRSGGSSLSSFDASSYPVRIGAEVHDFDPTSFMDGREAARTDRFAQMAIVAAGLALQDAELDEPDPARTGVIVGSGIGGLSTIEEQHAALQRGGPRRVSPFMVPRLMPNGAAALISMRFGVHGPNFAVASACATGGHAIGEALHLVRSERADVVLAGGSEAAITPLAVAAFARMGALSKRNDDPSSASRPFDAQRDGFVFGEGAGILVIESEEHARRRGADAIAEVAGYGATSDAFHVTQPDPEGAGATAAMNAALDDARLNAEEIDYINAHGTSTPYNDRIETLAIKKAFGNEAKRIPVTSTKSQTGHLLGAAGAVEAAVSALVIDGGVIPRTINLENADPDCDLDYVPDGAREEPVRAALSNSFGFGGQNACLVLKSVS